MQVRRQKDNSVVAEVEKRSSWLPNFDTIAVPLRAEWDALEVSLREVASLRVGDVIELPSALLTQTRILLNGTPKFIGTVGLDADRTAVQITRKLPRQDAEIPSQDSHGRKNS